MRRRSANSPRECSVARRQFNECTTTRATTPLPPTLAIQNAYKHKYKYNTNTNTNTNEMKWNTKSTTTRATTPRCHLLLQYKMQTNTNTIEIQITIQNAPQPAPPHHGATYSYNTKPPPPAAAWYCVWYFSSLLHSRTHMYTFPGQGWRQGLNIHFSRKGVQLLDLHGLD